MKNLVTLSFYSSTKQLYQMDSIDEVDKQILLLFFQIKTSDYLLNIESQCQLYFLLLKGYLVFYLLMIVCCFF